MVSNHVWVLFGCLMIFGRQRWQREERIWGGLKRLGVVILMSDWGDEGWKAKKKNDGNWEFTPIG